MSAPDIARCIATREGTSQDWETTAMVAHSLRADGFDASEDGTGRGTPIVPIQSAQSVREKKQNGLGIGNAGDAMYTQNQREEVRELTVAGAIPAIRRGDAKNESLIAFGWQNSSQQGASASVTPTLDKSKVPGIGAAMQVRRLTPRECERLQGFPDDYTRIPHRGKVAADGPRYKALGNSMAVPVVRWIGERIMRATAR